MPINLTVVLGVALFLTGVLCLYAANVKAVDRYRQLLLPPLALVYGFVSVLLLEWLIAQTRVFSERLAEYASFLAFLDTTFAAVCILNFALLLTFSVLKLSYQALVRVLEKYYMMLLRPLVERIYTYDDELQHWYLRDNHRGARDLSRNLFVCALVLSVLLIVASWIWRGSEAFSNPVFPAYAVLVLGEIHFLLSGITREEYRDAIEFEDDGSRRVFQYAKIQEILRHYFGDRVLRVGSRGSRKTSYGTHEDFCDKLLQSEDSSARLAGGYFKALVDKGLLGESDRDFDQLNHDVALNTVRLLNGKSILFATPFYRDFIPYVFLPASAQLLRNRRVLVVYGPEATETAMREYVDEGLSFVTGIPHMWTVGLLSESGDKRPDVALMPFSSLGNTRRVIQNAEYLRSVSFVIVVGPSSLLATYQIGLSLLSEYLMKGEQVCYCIFDRNSDGLIDSLSHALRTSLVEVGATEFAEASSVCMFWAVDGEHLQHRLLPGVARYLGVGTEIGLVALKSQVSKVAWASHSAVPLADERWIVGQYYGELLRFAELPQEQLQIDKSFEYHSDIWAMEKRSNRFIVAEDEYRNMFEAFRQFSTRGTEQSFVNILSSNYLLRDYMIDNHDMFSADPKAVPSFAPDFSKSTRNAVFSIIMVMAQSGGLVSEQEVKSRLRYAGFVAKNAEEALAGLLIDHISIADEFKEKLPEEQIVVHNVEEYDPATREITVRRYFSLSKQAAYANYFSSLKNVPLMTECDDGDLVLGACLYGHVYQMLLPGQFLTIQGKYYEVASVSEGAGVILRRAADHFMGRRYYRQLRTCCVREWLEGENPGDSRTISGLRVKRISAFVTVKTSGYLEMTDYGDIAHAHRVELSGIPDREYKNKCALRIELPGASPQVVATLSTLMSEALVSLFPENHNYISVVTPCDGSLPEGVLPRYEGEYEEGVIYIVEDSLIDIGLVSCVDRNLVRLFELCWDYLDWHAEKLEGRQGKEPEWEVGEPPVFNPPAKKGFFRRLIDRLKGASKRREKDSVGKANESHREKTQENEDQTPDKVDEQVSEIADAEMPVKAPVQEDREEAEADVR